MPRQLTPATPLFPGETTTAVPGSGRGNGNAATASITATDTAVTFTMKELKGGDTGELTVTWRLPAVTFRPGAHISQTVTASDTETQQTVTSAPILIGTASQYGVRIGMESPKDPAQVTVNADITYRVFPCIPNAGNPGATGVTNQTMSLTLPAGTEIVSTEGAPSKNADGTVLTWQIPDGTLNNCAAPALSYLVTVRYPQAIFQPAPKDPPASRTVAVRLTGTATGWDNKQFDASSASTTVQHKFWGTWISGTSIGTQIQAGLYTNYGGAAQNYVSYKDTEQTYRWAGAFGWFDTTNGQMPPIDYSLVNWNSAAIRFPCITDTAAISPTTQHIDDPIDSHNGGIGWIPITQVIAAGWDETDILPDTCHIPAFRPTRILLDQTSRIYTRHVSAITWDGTQVRVHNLTLPGGAGDGRSIFIQLYGDGNGNLGLSDAEIVTDLRVAGVGVPQSQSQWFYVDGTSTQSFADTGFKQMTGHTTVYRGITKWSATQPETSKVMSYRRHTIPREATQTFIDPVPDPQITLRSTAPEGAFAPGSTIEWKATLRNGVAGSPLTPLAAVNVSEGLTLIPESAKWSNLGTVDGIEPTLSSKAVTNQSGQKYTVYVWTWPDGTVMDPPSWKNSPDYPYYQAGELPTVIFDMKVAATVLEGQHSGLNGVRRSHFPRRLISRLSPT